MLWQIGDARVTRVYETDLNGFSAKAFFGVEQRDIDPFRDWMAPYLGAGDTLLMSVHALCIEVDGLRIVVDTCIGNDRDFGPDPTMQMFNGLHTSFLDDLAAAGFGPDDVDVVVCTHLHVDHVGWNTVQRDGRWVPTFPRARYVMARADVEYWEAAKDPLSPFAISVRPLLERGLVDAVALDHRISPSVSLMPTPGHTPGHVSVQIDSRGESGVITGDMIHSPIQLARPEWYVLGDQDPDEAVRSRRRLLERVGGNAQALVLGTHFPGATAGRVLRDGKNWRFV